jgi:hypothetical protein
MDNEMRRIRAITALQAYQELHGIDNDTDDTVDLLTDIFHMISGWGEDPQKLVETAIMHWEEER